MEYYVLDSRRAAAFCRRRQFLHPFLPRRHRRSAAEPVRATAPLGAVFSTVAVITAELRKTPGLKVMSANFETVTLDSRVAVGV